METMESMMLHYVWLSWDAIHHGLVKYPFPPKNHAVWHLVQNGRYASPKLGWCYTFENFAGRIGRIARNSTSGGSTLYMCPRIFERYRLVLFLRLSGRFLR